jgi:hypothetical protein
MADFLEQQQTVENYWRTVILFGKNVASYKFALAKSLIELSEKGPDLIKLEDLAEPFSRFIVEHLARAPKQATSPTSRPLEACRKFAEGKLGKDELIGQTAKLAFDDVIDRFHIVNGKAIPTLFYTDERKNSGGIRLTDELFRLRERAQFGNLPQEVEARWRLVETAWELNVARAALTVGVDDEMLVAVSKGRRTSVTSCRDALNGYQKGKCFYCFSDISLESTSEMLADVDHFHAWMLKQTGSLMNLDGIWNLVLACRGCNRGPEGKGSRLPQLRFLERLNTRNEFLIVSHHPLRETLIAQTGATRRERVKFLNAAYETARKWLVHTWQPKAENEPAF